MDIKHAADEANRSEAIRTVIACIVIVLLITILAFCLSAVRKIQETEHQALYSAWSQIHPDQQLTFDQWMVLYRANLLPGQAAR